INCSFKENKKYCIFCSIRPDHKTHLDFRGEKQEKNILNQWTADIVQEMTRDCGHSTGDDQRLRT
ncbi:unnamed protein product, partial [Staurois parvus]